ncbi:MAG: cobyric acid synthase, partial [Oscillospiraceae bacterium]|nr:cobyric acid synthase [Oscillospiraceae bacterium]
DVRMNPILLKPTTDTLSQVIVMGRVQGNMTGTEYYRKRTDYIPTVLEAYNSLAEENDIIVIEGAGSPAEINLKENDIVNMGLAELVDAPVLLVGDIDRGGVFAQLYGTVALLEEKERTRIKGLIVNKFRGERSILEPGLSQLEKLCSVKVAGVIPYTRADIDEEDSIKDYRDNARKLIDIVVIRLPHISNFTDFSPFERYENVSVRYVSSLEEFSSPDMIFIPGTKSTIADLKHLRQCGLEAAIIKAANSGTLVFGICGGYQMLGKTVSDPCGAEAEKGTKIAAMGLLQNETVFLGEKIQRQTSGVISGLQGVLCDLNGLEFSGYEIHMGRSDETLPAVVQNGSVYASYIHGLFDNPAISDAVIRALCVKKGIDPNSLRSFNRADYMERQYDLLADTVRAGLDMEFIYSIVNKCE